MKMVNNKIEDITLEEAIGSSHNNLIQKEKDNALQALRMYGEVEAVKAFPSYDGSYQFRIGIKGNYLKIDIEATNQKNNETHSFLHPLGPYKKLIKDYFLLCDSYYGAGYKGDKVKLEALDMARRGLHNEGADALRAGLVKHLKMNFETARAFFTLLCVLHMGNRALW